jgi:hypothetical protein
LERSRGRLDVSWAASADAAATSLRAGRLESVTDGWRLACDPGARVEVGFELETHGQRRCVALGFVLHTDAPLTLQLALEVDEAADPAPLDLILESAGTYAGVVELAHQPQLVRRVSLHSASGDSDLLVHDLFVISYG